MLEDSAHEMWLFKLTVGLSHCVQETAVPVPGLVVCLQSFKS